MPSIKQVYPMNTPDLIAAIVSFPMTFFCLVIFTKGNLAVNRFKAFKASSIPGAITPP